MTTVLVIVFLIGFICGLAIGGRRALKNLGRADFAARYDAAKSMRRFWIW